MIERRIRIGTKVHHLFQGKFFQRLFYSHGYKLRTLQPPTEAS